MLETLRRQSRSVVIYGLFGILIAVFIISFGPQSGQGSGCTPTSTFAARIGDHEVGESSWRFALLLKYGDRARGKLGRQARALEGVMDGLIERELLAQAAAAAGIELTTAEIERRIARGDLLVLGAELPAKTLYFTDGVFDYDALERFAKRFGLAKVGSFVEEQRQEHLAQAMRELLGSGVRVSPEEVTETWRLEKTLVEIEYYEHRTAQARRELVLEDAELAAWSAAHQDELKAKYDADKKLYEPKAGDRWVRLSQLHVAKSPPAVDAPAAALPAGAPDPARAMAEAALARLKAGEDFKLVARAVSDEERTKRRGGLADWRATSRLDPVVAAAVKTLEPGSGKTSDVLEGATGYWVVRLEAAATQALTYEQLAPQLAEPLALTALAREQARTAADAALRRARVEKVPFDQLYAAAPSALPTDAPPAAPPAAPPDGASPTATTPDGASPTATTPGAPTLSTSGPLFRDGTRVRGIGDSALLARAVFSEVAEGDVAPAVYETPAGFVLFRVTKKVDADLAELDKNRLATARAQAADKAAGMIEEWTQLRCDKAKLAGGISANSTYLEYSEAEGSAPRRSTWAPCMRRPDLSGLDLGGLDLSGLDLSGLTAVPSGLE